MEDHLLVRECDQCGTVLKKSTRFKNPQEQAALNAELALWVTIGTYDGTPEGKVNHFDKKLCAIQWLQKGDK